ncbi:hypothetical protein FB45DRAFT_1127282 [Roridomyces roridus]|uniref:F-box domain-containing protein n=1 Tax=Roridomyces roridus TaxID=1738132 RepID=A0AAD7B3W1_9AGAR|nr:hypothetical protein FB45DRAFT_1127282 [Roridomyces roridus]
MPHRCLSIQEIVGEICSQLNPYDPEDRYRNGSLFKPSEYYSLAPLAAMARTCRSFSEPALDELWSSAKLESVLLQSCMPDNAWHVSQLYGSHRESRYMLETRSHMTCLCNNGTQRNKGRGYQQTLFAELAERRGSVKETIEPIYELDASHGERLRLAAARVRHLLAEEEIVDMALLSQLVANFGRLQSVHWRRPDTGFEQLYSTFVVSSLVAIRLLITWKVPLATFAVQQPQLKEIHISIPTLTDTGPDHGPAIAALLGGLRHLERVTAAQFNYDGLLHLASLPNLRYLEAERGNRRNAIPDWLAPLPADIRAFPSLEQLALEASVQGITQLLGWCAQVPLQHLGLAIRANDSSTEAKLDDLFGIIPIAVSHATP